MTEPESTPESTPPAPEPDSFAARLKAAREAAGLSQSKAAKLVGVSAPTIANWEHARGKPSPQKQGAVLRKLREAQVRAELPPESYDAQTLQETLVTHPANQLGSLLPETVATPEELAHDPHDPVPEESTVDATEEISVIPRAGVSPETVAQALGTSMPDIPVGNVHTTAEGVLYRRLADDDDRAGAEVIDGRRWFVIGYVSPHPKAKARVKPVATPTPEAPPAPILAPQKLDSTPKATETPTEQNEPANALDGPKRGWAFWNA